MNYPKVELHCHLDGAIPKSLFVKYSRELNLIPEGYTDQKWIDEHVMTAAMTLPEALAQFDLLLKLLLKPEHLTETMHVLLNEMYDKGTRLAEIRFAPQSHKPGMSMTTAIEAVLEGRRLAMIDHPDMISGVLLCMMNYGFEGNLEDNLETIRLAAKYRDQGVVGIDLAGSEGLVAMEYYKPGFDLARELGLNITSHAGESAGPENVSKVIDYGAKRVGHGVHSIFDQKVVDKVIETGTTLEVSITSNVYSKAFTGYEQHPVRKLFDQGVKLNLNTDDPSLMNIDINYEYDIAKEKFGFTEKELIQTNLYGARASFCEGKEKLVNELEKCLESI